MRPDLGNFGKEIIVKPLPIVGKALQWSSVLVLGAIGAASGNEEGHQSC